MSAPRPEDTQPAVPQIPVSPLSQTGPFRVELAPDGVNVRVTTTGVITTGIVNDLDPTDAIWLATMIRAHALTVIEERRISATAQLAARDQEPVGPYASARHVHHGCALDCRLGDRP
jgi:hypothetical protein